MSVGMIHMGETGQLLPTYELHIILGPTYSKGCHRYGVQAKVIRESI